MYKELKEYSKKYDFEYNLAKLEGKFDYLDSEIEGSLGSFYGEDDDKEEFLKNDRYVDREVAEYDTFKLRLKLINLGFLSEETDFFRKSKIIPVNDFKRKKIFLKKELNVRYIEGIKRILKISGIDIVDCFLVPVYKKTEYYMDFKYSIYDVNVIIKVNHNGKIKEYNLNDNTNNANDGVIKRILSVCDVDNMTRNIEYIDYINYVDYIKSLF